MLKKCKNKFEKKIYRWLKRRKVIFQYEPEKIAYVLAKHYIPDFVIQTRLGRIYVEAKGYLRPEDKAKLVAVKRQHPNMDIRLLFYSNNVSNIKWANKCGFRYAVETIPLEWLQGL